MPAASAIRLQIETALAQRIPSALTPVPKMVRPIAPTGIKALDELLQGGFPIGAITELVGPECSGRTAVALSFLTRVTQANKVCAWIDVTNAFDPVSAAATGLDLDRLLWVRCGVSQAVTEQAGSPFSLPQEYLVPPTPKKGLHGGGFGAHPRSEVKGLSQAVSGLLRTKPVEARGAKTQARVRPKQGWLESSCQAIPPNAVRKQLAITPWGRMEQALQTTDLLLQGGGFSAIVLDMGSLAPEFVSRVPLATWHRYRLASERMQSSILLLTQYACAKSSAELALRLHPAVASGHESTVFSGVLSHVELVRQRFPQAPSNVIPLRKPPQKSNDASWQCRTAWAGPR